MSDTGQILLFRGLSVEDGSGLSLRRGCVLIERAAGGARVLAVGGVEEVAAHPAATRARLVDRPRSVLMPGLVNAHTHLDLTHIGPRPHTPSDGFVAFASVVMSGRRSDPTGIAKSVREGVRMCLESGTVAVGDIAACPRGGLCLEPLRELRASGLAGVSFLEFFGMGKGEPAAAGRLEAWLDEVDWTPSEGVRAGLQPHAPYSVSPSLYARAAAAGAERGIPLATHLAENPEERRFVARAEGPARDLLVRLGLWEDRLPPGVGLGCTPVQHLAPALSRARFLVAHVNDADDEALCILAAAGASVAYCPRSAEYFANETHFGPHRYRDMLGAGINVALGTDSVINLPPGTGLSVFDEARLLFRRDRADPRTLLRMATVNGAAALGLDTGEFRFLAGGRIAGIAGVEVGDAVVPEGGELGAALGGKATPELLLSAKSPFGAGAKG